MRAVVQRVREARVTVDGETVAAIGRGFCVLLGIAAEDDEDEAERLAGKVARLRVFENEEGKFDRSLLDVGGAALVVSQFTLIADSKRPNATAEWSPDEAADPVHAPVAGEGAHDLDRGAAARHPRLGRCEQHRARFRGRRAERLRL